MQHLHQLHTNYRHARLISRLPFSHAHIVCITRCEQVDVIIRATLVVVWRTDEGTLVPCLGHASKP